MNGLQVIHDIRARTPNVLVSFSRGKDSLATYLAVRDHFERVIPYTYEPIPGLEFVEESLAYYEGLIGQRIARFPAPGMGRMLNNLMYQPPDRIERIEWMQFPDFSHDNIQEAVCDDAGVDYLTTYNALGLRSADSAMRAMIVRKHGAINHTRRIFYPIHDLNKEQVIASIKAAGWKLPIDYRYFSASFDGLYVKYLLPIKRHFPRDYQRILEWFPLAELEVLRFESAVAHGQQPPYNPEDYT